MSISDQEEYEIYNEKDFQEVLSYLLEKHNCSVRIEKNVKLSTLHHTYDIVSWIDNNICDTFTQLLVTIGGAKNLNIFNGDVFECTIEEAKSAEDIEWSDVGEQSLDKWIETPLAMIEIYNEMLIRPSMFPIGISSSKRTLDCIHPGNNRYLMSKSFKELSDITADVIVIDMDDDTKSNQLSFSDFPYGIRIKQTGHDFRPLDFLAPDIIHQTFAFEMPDKIEIKFLNNNELWINNVLVALIDLPNRVLEFRKLKEEEIKKVIKYNYTHFEPIRTEKITSVLERIINESETS